MEPVILSLGPIQIRYYGVLIAIAFLAGYFILRKLSKEKNISENLIDNYFLWLVPSMIIGARLFEILFYEPAYYFNNPIKMLYIWQGGISSHGAIAAAILVTYFFTKKHKIHFYALADLAVIPCALGAAFVRIGNFINGEIVGTITKVPWAVKFQDYTGLRHPVQLYESFILILIFIFLYSIRKKQLMQGTLFWLFILMYSAIRFFLEFLKEMPRYFNLTFAQYFSLILVSLSIYFLWKIYTVTCITNIQKN